MKAIFLDAFEKRIATTSPAMFVRLRAWKNATPAGQIFVQFLICSFY